MINTYYLFLRSIDYASAIEENKVKLIACLHTSDAWRNY